MSEFPPRRILVPFDFTELSTFALRHAQALGGPDCRLELLYVAEHPGQATIPSARLSHESRRAVIAKLERAGGPQARGRVAQGDAAQLIARRAARSGADLIVMGTEGRRGLKRWARPSVAERVVRRCETPVLTVQGMPHPIRSILAPVKLESYAADGLRAAAQAAAAYGALLTVLCVAPARLAAEARRGLADMIAELPPELAARAQPQIRVDGGKAIPRILEQAPAFGLVVLVAHRRSLVGDAVLGTTAEQVLRYCPVPVLAVPSQPLAARAA